WATVPALLICLFLWVAKRDWRAGAVLLMVGMGIVPWIRDDLDGRTMFLFYALPAVPFMCLAIALVAGWLLTWARGHEWRWRVTVAGLGAYVALVVINFAYLYPVLAAQTLPYDVWHKRMWFSSWI
ncbi:MAG TPA: dolichyl-phosphate-mannose--protein mannosyltransferase, partial [Mycobacteriales bacterium]|nr:dolichyl-phosphate-mannose--protein mannosyltransferase [Mycobacteriales bacterium]